MKKLFSSIMLSILMLAGCTVVSDAEFKKSEAEKSVLQNLNNQSPSATQDENSWQKDVIYFLFVDRFYDGNSSNNAGNNASQYDSTKTDWKKYWGGDIQGLNDKLGYLKEMGVTSIWVTPLVDGIDTLTADGDAPYHGYWGKNYFNIDEHWGTWNEFDSLVSAMHSDSYNMKLILDYAPNHSNPNDEAEFGSLYKSSFDSNGQILNTWKITDYLQDTGGSWYHRLGGIGSNEWEDEYFCRYKNLFNLSDFNQDNSTTYSYLSAALATGLNAGGRYFANNTGCALLDFGYRSTIESVLKNSSSMRSLASYLNARESYWAEPLKQVVFLDNHDMPRINTVLRSSAGMSQSYAAARTDLGLAITMTVRGVPCVYYGTEQYAANFTTNSFGQVGSDPYNREMMPSFNTGTNAFNVIKTLAALRQTNKALQDGTYSEKWVDDTLISYERKSGGDVVVVAANIGPARTVSIPNLSLANGVYADSLGSGNVTVSGGTATVTLSENQVVVLASNSTYVQPPVGDGLNLKIYKNSVANWNNFNCYYWSGDGTSASNVWPGQAMTDDGDGWYSFTIDGASCANVIFNNGTVQTQDLSRSADGWFVPTGWSNGRVSGVWYDSNPYGEPPAVSDSGKLTIVFVAGANSENVSFPGDSNQWSLTSTQMTLAPNQTKSIAISDAVTSSALALGNDTSRLELKVVTNSSWSNQWNFSNWSKSSNISLLDGGRQIAILCSAGNNVVLTIDVQNLGLNAVVSAAE